MALDFPEYGEAMRRTLEVAERCSVEIELDVIRLPKFPVPDGREAFDYMVELCEKGLEKRYGHSTPELQERLRFELKTIREMGFTDYFLIVWDFIRFARQNAISVGPGRGSAAGSLVAYCLEITDVDPMRYDLLFERFLNPGRKEMPDMDIDFAVAGREHVINYVAEKYGRDRVAQIITFGTMMARAAVRDAGRVLDVPYSQVDRIAKLIPEGPKVYLDDCMKPGQELKTAYDGDPVVREIVDLAKPLEGLVRQDSIHAAGVVIGAEPLTNVVPLQQKGPDSEVVTQFGMWDVAALGLLKIDFLGLRNLDVIDKAVDADRQRSRHHEDPDGRLEDVRDARARRLGRRLPVRVVGDARGAARRQADAVRGPDRARRPLPAGADAVHPRVRAPEERPRPGHATSTRGWRRSPASRSASASTRSSTSRSRRSSAASRRPRPTTCARRSARRSTSSWRPSRRSSSRAAPGRGRRPRSRLSSGRTWSSPRTTPSTRPTPPATP